MRVKRLSCRVFTSSALDAAIAPDNIAKMEWSSFSAPTIEDFEALARAALRAIPAVFQERLDRLVVRVADYAPSDVLRELGIENPFELTGLYDGTALPHQSVQDPPGPPATVWLFRRPILDEWAERGDVALDALIAHVLVHEIAHHFGYSDADIARIDDWTL